MNEQLWTKAIVMGSSACLTVRGLRPDRIEHACLSEVPLAGYVYLSGRLSQRNIDDGFFELLCIVVCIVSERKRNAIVFRMGISGFLFPDIHLHIVVIVVYERYGLFFFTVYALGKAVKLHIFRPMPLMPV